MMKKLLIATGIFLPDIGGPASYALNLGEKLSNNISVTVVTYSSVIRNKEDKKLPFRVIRVFRGIPKGLRHLVYGIRLLWQARKHDTILALNAVSAGMPASFASKILKKKFFVRVVGDAAWEAAMNKKATQLLINDFQKSKKSGWIGRLHSIQTKVCKRADGVIVPSKYLGDMVMGWGVDADKIHVIYNGISFRPIPTSKEEARRKIAIHGNIILSVGRMVPWKGFKMLVKIMPKVLKINQFMRLVIVGDGAGRRDLEAMIKNLSLANKVYLVGRKTQEELSYYLAAADIFILNSGYEGFSHQIIESMSAGVPVITTAVGGNREIIKQGENGFMVRYNDEFNLYEAIKTLWGDANLRKEFVINGKKTAKHFSTDRMYKETIKILNS